MGDNKYNNAIDELYGDLETVGENLELQRVSKEKENLKAQLEASKAEIEELKAQLLVISNEKDAIEKNLVTIYNTALEEISRRDRLTQQLMSEIDDLKDRQRRQFV